jgi:predicted dehydrogenase
MTIGIGFIGTGFTKKVQIPAFAMCENVKLVSVASANLANAEKTAKEFNIEHWTDNWRETIEHNEVDLVCVSTPPYLHCEQTLYALAHDKHVLCEKPMAMSVAEAEKMCEVAKGKNVLALIDHELRMQNGRQIAFEILRNGEIGKIRHVRSVFKNPSRGDSKIAWNWWSDKTKFGGALGAIGSHIIDSFNWLLGTDVSSVFCQLNTHVKQRTDANAEIQEVTSDDEALLLLRFADSDLTEDATGTIEMSMVEFPDYQFYFEFCGTKGSLKIDYKGELFIAKDNNSYQPIDVKIGKGIEGLFDSGFPSGFTEFAPKIIEAIQNGKTEISHAATFEDGLRVQKILDAARESDANGKRIDL